MFDSGDSLRSVVEDLKNEVDIALEIPDKLYMAWANSLEQLIYREIIQEQREIKQEQGEIIRKQNDAYTIELKLLNVPTNIESPIRFEDIYTIFADHVQLTKTTLTSGAIFPNTYYKVDDNLGLNLVHQPKEIRVIYIVRPALKKVDEEGKIGEGNIMLPAEFVDLMKAKLRGEAYKLANEDGLAAKWINDYNVLLETFKMWLSGKQPEFGM